MHPEIRQDRPGNCPKCGMTLEPLLPIDGGPNWVSGAFLALQNEAFVNLSNRDDLNGKFFDQNRAYLAVGWRLNPSTDIEIGYLNQWINRHQTDTVNHVLQVAVYTFFR